MPLRRFNDADVREQVATLHGGDRQQADTNFEPFIRLLGFPILESYDDGEGTGLTFRLTYRKRLEPNFPEVEALFAGANVPINLLHFDECSCIDIQADNMLAAIAAVQAKWRSVLQRGLTPSMPREEQQVLVVQCIEAVKSHLGGDGELHEYTVDASMPGGGVSLYFLSEQHAREFVTNSEPTLQGELGVNTTDNGVEVRLSIIDVVKLALQLSELSASQSAGPEQPDEPSVAARGGGRPRGSQTLFQSRPDESATEFNARIFNQLETPPAQVRCLLSMPSENRLLLLRALSDSQLDGLVQALQDNRGNEFSDHERFRDLINDLNAIGRGHIVMTMHGNGARP